MVSILVALELELQQNCRWILLKEILIQMKEQFLILKQKMNHLVSKQMKRCLEVK